MRESVAVDESALSATVGGHLTEFVPIPQRYGRYCLSGTGVAPS